jgi:hypothetical protein
VQVSRLHHIGGTIQGSGVLRPDSLVWTAGTQLGPGATAIAAGAILLVNGPVNWQRPLVNQGTILWAAGNIAGGNATLQNSGLFDMQLAGASLYWAAGTTPVFDNLATGTVLRRVGAGTGVAELTGATLDVAAGDTVQVSRLHQLGGVIQGSGVLRADSLVWTAGTQLGAGTTFVAAGATLLVNGSVNWQRALVNQGTVLWTGGNIAGSSATFVNASLFDMQVPTGSLYWAAGATPIFDNQATGTVLRRVGTGAVTFDVTLNNAGAFDVQSGRAELTRGGTSATDLTVQSGMTLELAAGTYTLGTGTDFGGAGLVELTAAIVDVAATDTVRVGRLHQLGGTIQGTGVLRPDSLVWTAGTQSGAGATHIATGTTLLVNGTITWQRQLVNQGTLLWTA